MWAAGLDPFLELSPREARWVSPLFQQYTLFMQSKNLGVKFSPNDMDTGTLRSLSTIHTAISDVQDRRNRRKKGK